VLSGKGGTGKTTLTASFATLSKDLVVTDCDVDAADLHLLLQPREMSKQEFKGSKKAVIDKSKCTRCEECGKSCRFNAIENFTVNSILCEGCGVCAYVCPEHAINLEERVSGCAFISKTRFGYMTHAQLGTAEENSGKLVTLVRQNAVQIAKMEGKNLVLIDGPPGIGCPAIASINGVDLAILVTEPTLSGLHDLERILNVAKHFGVPSLVCINMYDINKENTERITEFCRQNSVELGGKIPFDPIVTEAMVAGKTVVEYSPNHVVSKKIEEIWNKIQSRLIGNDCAQELKGGKFK
jgi:MinD superfamily P-loop ATPase